MTAKVIPLPARPHRARPETLGGRGELLSDEALLAACATGDAAALGALFDRFHAALYRFATRLATTDELARDDLVQATFLEICRTAHTFRGTSSVKTWIFGVAANVARHTLRGEQRRRVHQARYLERIGTTPMLVDDQVDRRKLLMRIAGALDDLPRDQQIAFLLCDLEQLPGAEVARVLDIPEGTLWRRLHTARRAMRAALDRSPS
jgi:RNA polymerase sigma-70 factor (ECF subfamily)